MMTRSWLVLVLMATAATLSAQLKAPSFLAPAALEPTLVTPHLDARAAGDVIVDAGGAATLVILVTPKPKMHVYSADVEGYVPFTVTVAPSPGVKPGKVAHARSELYVFPPTGESSRAYMKPFKVSVPLTVSAEGRAQARKGTPGVVTLRYQACDDAVCYRPTTGSFTYTIR